MSALQESQVASEESGRMMAEATEFLDFRAEGGFVIECKEGLKVGVSGEQAARLEARCEYFRNVFQHGTRETADRILVKKDWSVVTARIIIETLTTQFRHHVGVTSMHQLLELMEASDHILLDLRLCSVINLDEVLSKQETQLFLSLVDTTSSKSSALFELVAEVDSSSWLTLLRESILLYPQSSVFTVAIGDSEERINKSKRVASPRGSQFTVFGCDRLATLQKLTNMLRLSQCRPLERDQNLQLNKLAIPVKSPTQNWYEDFLKTSLGCYFEPHFETYIIKQARNYSGWEWRSFCGSFSLLYKQYLEMYEHLKEIKDTELVTLVVVAPSPDTCGRLINACQTCSDYKGTIGWDRHNNCLVVIKSLEDTRCVLEYMADYSSSPIVTAPFKLIEVGRGAVSF